MPHKPNLSVYLSPTDLPALRRAARGLGYVLTTGPRAGQGSVRKMLEAISRCEIVCMYKNDILKHADELRELADNLDMQNCQDAAISLRALADALRRAAEIKKD